MKLIHSGILLTEILHYIYWIWVGITLCAQPLGLKMLIQNLHLVLFLLEIDIYLKLSTYADALAKTFVPDEPGCSARITTLGGRIARQDCWHCAYRASWPMSHKLYYCIGQSFLVPNTSIDALHKIRKPREMCYWTDHRPHSRKVSVPDLTVL